VSSVFHMLVIGYERTAATEYGEVIRRRGRVKVLGIMEHDGHSTVRTQGDTVAPVATALNGAEFLNEQS